MTTFTLMAEHHTGVEVAQDLLEQAQAHPAEFPSPERLRGVGGANEAVALRGNGTAIDVVGQPVHGPTGDLIADVDRPPHGVASSVEGK